MSFLKWKKGIILILVLGIQASFSFCEEFFTFDSVFEKISEINLQTKNLEVGVLRELHIDSENNFLFLDPKSCQILVFDKEGKFINKIGEKGEAPGKFILPIAMTVSSDGSGEIVISDSKLRRINRFDKDGKFLSSFIILPSHWQPKIIRLDSKGNYYLGGLNLAKNGYQDWINQYDLKGRYKGSFFKRNTKQRWLSSMYPAFSFDIDENDIIYAIQINKYEISSFATTGDLIKKSSETPSYFIEPDHQLEIDYSKYKNPSALRNKLEKLSKSWIRILQIRVVTDQYLFVILEANGFIEKSNQKFKLDIWDKKDLHFKGGILTDYIYLTSDRAGYVYFLLNSDEEKKQKEDFEYKIGKYKLKIFKP
ncbi:6-bladed beta-propeller [Acidobacteriota bacterium]